MSNTSANIGSQLYNHAIQTSETFREDMSHVLVQVVVPKVEQLLLEQGIHQNTYQGKQFVSSFAIILLGDIAQKMEHQLGEVSTSTVFNEDGTDFTIKGILPDYVRDRGIQSIAGKSIISEVLNDRDTQIATYNVLVPLTKYANQYFKPKVYSVTVRDGANWKDIFPSNVNTLTADATEFDPGSIHQQSLSGLKERIGLFLDIIYNKVLLEWTEKIGIANSFKHEFYLVDEPTLKKGTKGRNIEFVHFLPVDTLMFHIITTYLSRGQFDLSTEHDIVQVELELLEQDDLDTFATIIAEELRSKILPFIQDISTKKPFLEWFQGKINKESIRSILKLLNNASKNRSNTNMLNPYWFAKIDNAVRLRKVTLSDYVSES